MAALECSRERRPVVEAGAAGAGAPAGRTGSCAGRFPVEIFVVWLASSAPKISKIFAVLTQQELARASIKAMVGHVHQQTKKDNC